MFSMWQLENRQRYAVNKEAHHCEMIETFELFNHFRLSINV